MAGQRSSVSSSSPVAVVTGATGTIGRSVINKLIAGSYTVIASGRRPEWLECPPSAEYIACDHLQTEDIKSFADVLAQQGAPDLFLHCAGITADGPLTSMSEENWDTVWQVNFQGAVAISEIAAQLMQPAGKGSIVLLGSQSGIQGKPGQGNYSAAKGALLGYMESAARRLGKVGIRINAVIPGYIPGGMADDSSEAARKAAHASCLNQFGNADITADAIIQIAENQGITGQVLPIDTRINIAHNIYEN